MIEALIFDFDGLILDTEYHEYIAWVEVFHEFGLTLPLEDYSGLIGRGASTIERSPYDMIEEQLGKPIDRDAVRLRHRTLFSEFIKQETTLPGVESLIAEAKERGMRLAVASSSPRVWVMGFLTQLGLLDRFNAIRTADDVRYAKPDPELYRAALDALGLQPSQAVALEDSANGVAAAKAAGLFCVAVPNRLTKHVSLAAADLQVNSLADLPLPKLLAAAST